MAAISVRFPDDLDRALAREAKRLHVRRSELVREAVQHYLTTGTRQRFMGEMVSEMHRWLDSSAAREDSRHIAEDIADNDLVSMAAAGGDSDSGPDRPWWR